VVVVSLAVVVVVVVLAVVVDAYALVDVTVLAVVVDVVLVDAIVVVVLAVADVGACETVELPLGASVKPRLASRQRPLCCLLPRCSCLLSIGPCLLVLSQWLCSPL
jgi:hypothetical protein